MDIRNIGNRCVAAGFALLGTLAVLGHAWVTEDAFITFRYVSNTLQGYGPVFNVGEHVHGYTHPLWFLLLTGTSWIYRDPIIVSAVLGLVLTFATIFLVGTALFRTPGATRTQATLGTAIFALLCASSVPWLSFQTGGLENSLSHLLIAAVIIEFCQHDVERPFRLTLLLGLLCLSRPDLALLALPISLALLASVGSIRTVAAMAAGALPLVGWLAFSWLYYGTPVPNTAYAKLGIFPNWTYAVGQGLAYVGDWALYDPVAAAGGALLLYFGFRFSQAKRHYACAAGIVLYLLWIVWIGGDFMRGRFLLPVFTASLVFGLLLALPRLRVHALALRSPRLATGALILIALFVLKFHQDGNLVENHGIRNERNHYPGYHLRAYLRTGRVVNPYLDLTFADDLRAYAKRFGPLTIHSRNPGTLGYLSGPEVSIIDTLGLTDAYIAQLPKPYLFDHEPRPGHPDKVIPLAYLARRGDIAFLRGWQEAIKARDGEFLSQPRQYVNSKAFWIPVGPVGRIVDEVPGLDPAAASTSRDSR